jgi:maltokinase
MDDRTVLPAWQDRDTGDDPVVVHRYRLGLETGVCVRSTGNGWWCDPERSAGGNVAAEEWAEAEEGDGAAQAFVDLLRYAELPAVPGFRVVRLVPPPEATGERGVEVDLDVGVHSTVVVGERVVVTWTRRTVDAPHPGVLTLQHLAAVDFIGVPDVYGLLLWRTPSGHEVPVAIATRYLPRSRTGWAWAAELVEVAAGVRQSLVPTGTPPGGIDLTAVELPARLGRLVAKLHLALATPSVPVPVPAATVDGQAVHEWRAAAQADVDAAVRLAVTGPAGGLEPGELPTLLAAVDGAADLARRVDAGAATVTVQRVHGDLHIGRVLRWTGGLSVVGFDAEPHRIDTATIPAAHAMPAAADGGELAPAARDVARLLASLREVARVAADRPGMPPAAPGSWYRQARDQVLRAYRSVLATEGRPELLDEQLLAMFEAQEWARAAVAQGTGQPSGDHAPIG